jgi:putative hydrolase of the HAD superfamily
MAVRRVSTVRALLLDALGTLVALEPPAPALRAELADRFGVRVSEAEAEHALRAEIEYYHAHMGDGRNRDSLLELRGRCAEVLREALPDEAVIAAIGHSELTDALLASLRFTVFDDAPSALAAARKRGLRVAVASNWDVSLHEVLDRLGLAAALDAIVTSAEVGARKPAPGVFVEALRRLGVPAAEAVHVGDGVAEDVDGARSAGVRPILIARTAGAVPAGVTTITSLAELADVT